MARGSGKLSGKLAIFSSPLEFSLHIETEAIKNKQTIIEAVMDAIDEYNLELEDVKSILSESLLQKLRKEGENMGWLVKKKTNTLDFL